MLALLPALLVGLVLALILTAANLYLGLYAGMTVSASIPASVLGLAFYRLIRRRNIHEVNLVQTLASSGESLAAGALFTVPALVIAGYWTRFPFWPTFFMTMSGSLLGLLLMVPLRKKLMEDKNLKFPEGVACAEVLRAGMPEVGPVGTEEGTQADPSQPGLAGAEKTLAAASLWDLVLGVAIGGGMKVLTGMAWLAATVEGAWRTGWRGVIYAGMDASPALLAVGYLTGTSVALQVFAGGALAWGLLPFLSGNAAGLASGSTPLDFAWMEWSQHLRYLGAGTMVVAGLGSLAGILPMVWEVLVGAKSARARKETDRLGGREAKPALGLGGMTESPHVSRGDGGPQGDMRGPLWWGLLTLALVCVFGLYFSLMASWPLAMLATALAAVASFVWVAVSSHIVGLVGSSNNPVSGMTLSALLGTALLLLLAGFRGHPGVTATLGVAAVVCCAACAAADGSQDLKTGYLLGTSPWRQQVFEVLGAIVPALLVAPVLNVLHQAYGLGVGLKAPQATLFAHLAQGVFGQGDLPVRWLSAGLVFGCVLVTLSWLAKRRAWGWQLHPMAVAVGMYLPFSLSAPIAVGGLAQAWMKRRQGDAGASSATLLASGLVAGEALVGVALALLVFWRVGFPAVPWGSGREILTLLAFGGVMAALLKRKPGG